MSGKNFIVIRPAVPEILGIPQMPVSCQKEQMPFTVKPAKQLLFHPVLDWPKFETKTLFQMVMYGLCLIVNDYFFFVTPVGTVH